MSWYSDDGLWSGFSELMWPQRLTVEADELVRESPLLAFPAGSRVLDLCCGPGRFVVPLARKGYQVTGVDLNAPVLDRAKQAAADAGVPAELVQGDMLEFVRPGGFDVVLNMYTSFGYFDDAEKNLQVLRNAHTSLAPGGKLLLEVYGKEIVAKNIGRTHAFPQPDGIAYMRHSVLDDWTKLRTDWTLVDGDTARSAHIQSYIYSAAELRRLFEDAGFTDIEAYGGFDGAPYDKRAKRLIVQGAKA